MPLNETQIERYNRHILLSEVDHVGQEKLLNSKVLIIGSGGLGSPATMYLAAAGIGTLGLMDSDKVDMTNLQRQIIHLTDDVGKDKILSAEKTVHDINPDVNVKTYNMRAKADNIRRIVSDYDFVIDATDNFGAKFLINDACYFEKKPLAHAGVLRFDGQIMTIIPGETTCYRCIFNSSPPENAVLSCAEQGVLGVVAGVLGLLQATEAFKYLLGLGDLLTDKLLTYNALTMEFRKIPLKKNPACPICGDNPSITEIIDE